MNENDRMLIELARQLAWIQGLQRYGLNDWSPEAVRYGFVYRTLYQPHRLEKEAKKRDEQELRKSAKIVADSVIEKLGLDQ